MRYIGDLFTLRFLPPAFRWAIYALGGIILGMLAVTVRVSEAYSYISDDPKACENCHIMTTQYATWERSSHREVATCTDCHIPHENIVRKYAFKAKDGLRHTLMFTFRMEPQVIRPILASKKVIYDNCLRCHQQKQLSQLNLLCTSERNCTECHRTVPHGDVDSISATPNVRRPTLPPIRIWPFGHGETK
jgi:cytochrome c nitrite reductase small subunit